VSQCHFFVASHTRTILGSNPGSLLQPPLTNPNPTAVTVIHMNITAVQTAELGVARVSFM
jgi:hypothetical protein